MMISECFQCRDGHPQEALERQLSYTHASTLLRGQMRARHQRGVARPEKPPPQSGLSISPLSLSRHSNPDLTPSYCLHAAARTASYRFASFMVAMQSSYCEDLVIAAPFPQHRRKSLYPRALYSPCVEVVLDRTRIPMQTRNSRFRNSPRSSLEPANTL
jgi:hypothetical protein